METTYLVIFTLLYLFFQTSSARNNNTMPAPSNVTCNQRERQSLLVFRQGLTDKSNRLSTWIGVECCEWQGVGCDRRNDHVVKLDLRSPLAFINYYTLNTSNWLQGKVSPSLLNLKHLRYLDLSMNDFSGQNIPEFFGSFPYLQYLNLSYSGFSGVVPPTLGNLSRLQYLDLNLLDRDDMFSLPYDAYLMVSDDLRWVSLLSLLKHLDLSGVTISKNIDWFHPMNKLLSLLTLNLASCDIDVSSIKFINITSLNSLDLYGNNITSTIPVWLSNFTGLVHLNIGENNFHGQIPNFIGTLSSLSYLRLSSNELSGPISPSLGGLSSLRVLSLSRNQLSESIPESIGQLSMLEYLYLPHNQLSGSIPEIIGQLSMLKGLFLWSNQLSGSIPESIGLLTGLEILDLSRNQLTGSIPTNLDQLSNLLYLYLYGNQLSGVISEIHFTKLNNLTYLDLSDNSLTLNVSPYWIPPFQLEEFGARSCNIGSQFPSLIQKSIHLKVLDLSNSSIRDNIPDWFQNISSHIVQMDLSDNHFGGNLPRITNNSDIRIVNLRGNYFTGSVPTHLCELLSIELLDLSDNNYNGGLPKCLGNLTQLKALDLARNTITGVVPNSLSSLSYLQSLHLRNNKFEGNLHVALQNLTSLVTFDLGNNLLTGNIPSWIGKKLLKLRILNLRSNKFIGEIPLELCQNKALQHLNIANNNITGTIPHCFCNLTGMTVTSVNFKYKFKLIYNGTRTHYVENIEACIKGSQWKYTTTMWFLVSLDLSNNKIIGEIPDVLMNLVALNNLNLSRNLLNGQIPARIGNLKQMESLDFSMNMLSGRIPPGLANLNFLSYLNLSFNNLFGKIPVGNQLQTLGNPSTIYEGNDELCGPPLLRSCIGKNLLNTRVGKEERKDDIEDLWFYTGMALGFVVGFIGLIGSLFFVKNWRVAYFNIIENVYAWLTISIIVTLARIRRKFSG